MQQVGIQLQTGGQMVTKLLIILLFASICFGQIQQNHLSVIAKKNTYSLLANNYKTREIADGGSVINMAAVDSAITNAQDSSYYDSTKIWIGADFGVKKDANNKVTKLYNIKGTNDFSQADTSKAGTWFASGGADSRPYIHFGIVATFNDFMDAASAVNIAS